MRSAMTVFFLVSALWANAQSDELIIRGVTGNLYLDHTVQARETWYGVGRLFNVNPKTLARYNHRTFAHSLDVGETLKVPLTEENFSQNGKKLPSETLVPVYHIVQEKEWMYRISVNHNKVPIPMLEKWNHVTGDQVHAGLHMIVGYLKVRTALSALAKRRREPAVAAAGEQHAHPSGAGSEQQAHPSAAASGEQVHPATAADGQAVHPSGAANEQPAQSPAVVTPGSDGPTPHFGGGKFRDDYANGGHSLSGQAGIFKSTSGWQDGKYYALIDDIPVGTIVKITDQANGKSVYAKVLGQLPDMKESAGLTVRMSNAAAAELGEGEARFGVGVNY